MTEAGSKRTCLACRETGDKGGLIRLADTPYGVMLDYAERFPGRGAYLCPRPGCIQEGLTAKALSRAFKKKVDPPEPGSFMESLGGAIDNRIRSLVGMARKSGNAAYGFDSVQKSMRAAPGGLLMIATDASDKTVQRFMDGLIEGETRAVRYSTKAGLGDILGTRPVGLAYIADEGLASALMKEFERRALITGGE